MKTLFAFLFLCFGSLQAFAQAPAQKQTSCTDISAGAASYQKVPVRIYNATGNTLVPCKAIYKEHPIQDYKIVQKDFFRKIDPSTTRTLDGPLQLWSDIGVSVFIEAIPSYGMRVTVFEDQDPNTYKTMDEVEVLKTYFEPYSRATILEIQPDFSILFK
jgi:hypothetical protein